MLIQIFFILILYKLNLCSFGIRISYIYYFNSNSNMGCCAIPGVTTRSNQIQGNKNQTQRQMQATFLASASNKKDTINQFFKDKGFTQLKFFPSSRSYGLLYQAIKNKEKCMIQLFPCKNQDQYNRMLKELNKLKSISHENLIKILDIHQNTQYNIIALVMPYYDFTLQNMIQFKLFDSYGKIRKMMLALMSGLSHLHEKKTVHRNINSQNIVMKGDSQLVPVYLNFGQSKLVHKLKRGKTIKRNPPKEEEKPVQGEQELLPSNQVPKDSNQISPQLIIPEKPKQKKQIKVSPQSQETVAFTELHIYKSPYVGDKSQNPEQYTSDDDIYSLGVVFCQILFNLSKTQLNQIVKPGRGRLYNIDSQTLYVQLRKQIYWERQLKYFARLMWRKVISKIIYNAPQDRPTFAQIKNFLTQGIYQSEDINVGWSNKLNISVYDRRITDHSFLKDQGFTNIQFISSTYPGNSYYGTNKQKKKCIVRINTFSNYNQYVLTVNQSQNMNRPDHENIMKIYAILSDDNSKKIGLVEPQYDYNLQGYMLEKPLNSQLKMTKVMQGLLSGLSYLHQRKIMHRNIKPQNIKFFKNQPSPVPIIVGFEESVVGTSVASVGTPLYMAPQVAANRNNQYPLAYGNSVDIYSLGIIYCQIIFNLSTIQLMRLTKQKNCHFYELQEQKIRQLLFQKSRKEKRYSQFIKKAWELIVKMIHVNVKKRATISDIEEFFSKNGIKQSELKGNKSQIKGANRLVQKDDQPKLTQIKDTKNVANPNSLNTENSAKGLVQGSQPVKLAQPQLLFQVAEFY